MLPRPIKVGQLYDFSHHVILPFQDIELVGQGTRTFQNFYFPNLQSINGIELAAHYTGSASRALFQIDDGRFFLFPGNCLNRAVPKAYTTHLALFRTDDELDQIDADLCRTGHIMDVGFVFVPEVTDC